MQINKVVRHPKQYTSNHKRDLLKDERLRMMAVSGEHTNNPERNKKISASRKGIPTNNPFKKGNQYGSRAAGFKKNFKTPDPELTRMFQTGRKQPEAQKEKVRIRLRLDNPMWSEESKKKNILARRDKLTNVVLTEEILLEAERMYNIDNLSLTIIANKIGIMRETLRKRLAERGLKINTSRILKNSPGAKKGWFKTNVPITEELLIRIEDMYMVDNLSLYNIAKKIGIDKRTVRRILTNRGVKIDQFRLLKRTKENNLGRQRQKARERLLMNNPMWNEEIKKRAILIRENKRHGIINEVSQ